MGRSIVLAAYLAAANRWTGFAKRTLTKRLARGKEDPARIGERSGKASIIRPEGRLIWFHAASVGESLSLIDLIARLLADHPDLHVLVTTGTLSSSQILSERLPERAIHQFAPVDVRPYIRSFLTHWKPDLAIWTESELWPGMIYETHKSGVPMILLNARISAQSFKSWKWLRGMMRSLLNRFDHILTQDTVTMERLRKLGAWPDIIKVNGSLKQGGGALPHNEAERADLANTIGTRPIWLAASTHPGEEDLAAEAHARMRRVAHRLLLIIAPRHPERGPQIAAQLREAGWRVGLRSDDQEPDAETDIYVADTLGEMGLWYRLAPITFLGGSLVPVGGHNPFEPAALGSAIVHGPYTDNASETYEQLQSGGGARLVTDVNELCDALSELLEPHKAAAMAHSAWEVSSRGAEATDSALALISDMLDARAL